MKLQILMSLIPGKALGKVGKINIKENDEVKAGDILAQVETGKGNRPVKATKDGKITKILITEGQDIKSKEPMFDIEVAEEVVKTENIEKKEIKAETELAIIGGGPGGYVAAIYAAKNGIKVTLIEMDNLGGTCLNVGCIPTKALVASAHHYQEICDSKEFGINISGEIKPNMAAIIDRKNEIKAKLVNGIEYLMSKNKINVIKGKAKFINKNEVSIEAKETITKLKTKDIIIATGSKIAKLPIKGLDKKMVLNSTEALNLKKLPKSITIIGGGVIGMEFAFIYATLGVKVNVVEFMDRVLPMVDREAIDEITNISKNKNIKIYTNSRVKEIKESNDGEAIVVFAKDGNEEFLVSENVLVAVGREPNIDGLEIDKAEIQTWEKKKGIKVDEHMRTNISNIYAIGDVTNIIQLAHVASHQGIVAVKNLLGNTQSMKYHAVPNVIFTMPEIASVGLNEEECKAKNLDYKSSRFNYEGNGKALTLGETAGFIKIIEEEKTKKILGATIIGADASALISTLTIAMANGLTAENIRETIFAHPTTSEIIHEAAMGLGIGVLHQ